ncbi:MAG: IS66 family transposase, partial [Gammaproteobacteria bacterium]|nr:IS66 family transposase [Gammaproteobacteria bacterium]
MRTASDRLPDDPEELRQIIAGLQSTVAEQCDQIDEWQAKYQNILEQFRLAQQRQFGQSGEAANQLGLFNEGEEIEVAVDETEPDTDTITYTRNKPRRKPLPRHLPRETIVHDIEDKACDCCGHDLHRIGEETSEQLEFIPAQVKVIEHVRPKYGCRHCEQQGTEVRIKIASVPKSPIPKSMATPSLLAHIITSKYQYALPLYRQEQMFRQFDIDLNRKTMSEWMMRCGELLEPLYQRLKVELLKQTRIQADETPVQVLKEDKHRCYMWVYCTGSDSPDETGPPNIVLYDYQASRSGQCARDYLDGFRGYLQVDGYAGYQQTEAVLVGCWAHARRKFVEAKKAQPKGKSGRADWAISHIQKLYRIESEIKNLEPAEKQLARQERARSLLDEFKSWLDKSANQVPPKMALGKAVAYTLGQWEKLERYLEDGHLQIDNNRVERAVKPFVIGRKNWLFSNTANGAKASAMLYSIIETAKASGLVPYDYLRQ